MFVIDPKGENAAITARARSAANHVHIVNPWGAYRGTCSRQLGFLAGDIQPPRHPRRRRPERHVDRPGTRRRNMPGAREGRTIFWKGQRGRLLMAAVFLYLAYQPGEKKTLARARQITSMNRKRFTEILDQDGGQEAFDGAIREIADQFIDMADDTYSGITYEPKPEHGVS